MEDSVSINIFAGGHFVDMVVRQCFEKSKYQVSLFRVGGNVEHRVFVYGQSARCMVSKTFTKFYHILHLFVQYSIVQLSV